MAEDSKKQSNTRHDWYQTEAVVVVSILIRDVKHEQVQIDYTETNLNVDIKLDDGNDYTLDLKLAHRIVPDKCSYKVMSTKVEVKLAKLEGLHWSSLEGDPEKKEPKIIALESSGSSGPPRYPSSNPHHRDWNAIEKDLIQELAKEKPVDEEGVNSLFQKIYGEGNDEVKRAMNKSYLESGGTVLSTNWNEISKETVPVKPPDGMVWKKWDS